MWATEAKTVIGKMQFRKAAALVSLSLVAMVVLVHSASVGELKNYSKRADNYTGMTPEEATKTCNQSFVIKMGKVTKNGLWWASITTNQWNFIYSQIIWRN